MLKIFLFMAFLSAIYVLAGRTEEQKKQHLIFHQECGEDEETKELLTKARNGEWSYHPKLAAHILCYTKKLGWLNSAGKFNIEETRKHFADFYNKEQVDNLMENCIVERDTPEKTAVDLFKCRQHVLYKK